MSHKSYSKIHQTLSSFQKDCRNPKKIDQEDEDTQTTSKTFAYNIDEFECLTMTSSQKPILKPTKFRRNAKKSQISEDKKKTHFRKPLREIHIVESYKEYNIDASDESGWFCGFSCFFKKSKWENL